MPNVFLLYMPPGNPEAIVHYQDTIKNKVTVDRISRFLSGSERARLTSVFGNKRIAVWGSQAGPRNRSNFDRMSQGDDILIIEGDSIKLMGKVASKVESQELSQELWQPLAGARQTDWRLIYFIANPRELDVPFAEFCNLFGYSTNFQLRGFTTVAPARLKDFHAKYDDLYSVLERIQRGEPVARKHADAIVLPSPADLAEISGEQIDDILNTPVITEHVRMQWTLARLGLKAGERVWVPAGDQSRLRSAYDFESFDAEFSTGIDLPPSYLENIDVVWKQQFRIGAAYEIENSTSIYSGLLRFADLNIVAPNTLYPMFIVAPREKKHRLRAQLQRPAFKRLELDNKVRFLPYETIDEIDKFFANSDSGLSVDLIVGRSESVI
jgi:hypothetical protein